MDVESGYEAGSEATQTSSGSEISPTERKKPCEICGSNANEDEIMTCFSCKNTREHTYCSRVMQRSVPRMWICDECSTHLVSPSWYNVDRIATSSRTSHQVVDSEVVHDHNMITTCESGNQFSATHQASLQAHATSPVGSSPNKIPDLNLPSDLGSAI